MKKLFYLCVLMLFIGVLSACTTQNAPAALEDADETLTIVSIGPAITEVLVAIGVGDKIIATDDFSAIVPGVPANVPTINMMAIDVETIIMLSPDIVIATEMITFAGDPLALVAEMGARVVYVPQHNSISGIIDNIHFIAEEMSAIEAGQTLTQNMQAEINKVRAIAETIPESRTVYFEIDPSPFTFGEGSFLHEILELIGAVNIFADIPPWTLIADEQILTRNPEVILTNVSWLDDPINEIKSRPGWDSLNAVINSRVYLIDTDSSSRDNHNIVKAMWEIARAVYPDYFN